MKNILVILAILFTVSTETMAQFSFTVQTDLKQLDVAPTSLDSIYYRFNVNYQITEQVFVTAGILGDPVRSGWSSPSTDFRQTRTGISIGNKYMFYGYEPVYLDDAKTQTPFEPLDSLVRPYISGQINYYTLTTDFSVYDMVEDVSAGYPKYVRGNINEVQTVIHNSFGYMLQTGILVRLGNNVSGDISAGVEYAQFNTSKKYKPVLFANIGISYGL